MLRKILFILLPVCTLVMPAEAQTGILHSLDSMLGRWQSDRTSRYDTAYIGKPVERWTVKLRLNMSGTGLDTRGNTSVGAFESRLETEPKATVGASVSYRGLSLALSLNPAKLSGRNKDYELNLTSYGNRMGAELSLLSSRTFSGTVVMGGTESTVPAGQVGMKMIQGNAYYAFSHRRFSFPAAFSQSQVQKRSCGSWLLGLSAFAGSINADGVMAADNSDADISIINVAVGGGYAYNLVTRRRWLVHGSVVPAIVVYSRTRLTVGGLHRRSPMRFPMFNNVGRLAVVRSFGKRFAGLSAVVSLWHQGDSDRLQMESLKWRARVFYGFRF